MRLRTVPRASIEKSRKNNALNDSEGPAEYDTMEEGVGLNKASPQRVTVSPGGAK